MGSLFYDVRGVLWALFVYALTICVGLCGLVVRVAALRVSLYYSLMLTHRAYTFAE